MVPTDVVIRPATQSDQASLQALLGQLGYGLDPAELARRFATVTAQVDHGLLVAERAGAVIALCHVYARPALDKPPEAVVQALVVDAAARGRGVGQRMMDAAEHWARGRGFTSVALTSAIARADAHGFYAALGYHVAATSHLFRKALA